MLKAKHHSFIYPMFKRLTRILLWRNFNSIKLVGNFVDKGKSVLVLANHVSWWDGFWLMHLNLDVVKRKLHFMMLEEQLRKHWYFQYTGGYSIKKKTRSVIETLAYTLELLNHDENMVFMFPQGEIQSMYKHPIKFEMGVGRIISACSSETQILFVANLFDYFSNSKPNLYIYMKQISAEYLQGVDIENEYNRFYQEALNAQKRKIG